jgi:hypothetical protein
VEGKDPNKIRNEKEEITANTKETTRDYFENLYLIRLENLEEMDKFLDIYNHLKLNEEDITHLNRSITCNESKTVIKSLTKRKSPGPDGFSTEFYQTFKRRTNTNTSQTFPRTRKGRNTAKLIL